MRNLGVIEDTNRIKKYIETQPQPSDGNEWSAEDGVALVILQSEAAGPEI